MALVIGTNCGFVTVAPTADPAATGVTTDRRAYAIKVVVPATATHITSVGWWNDNTVAEEANWEAGLYTDAGANEPEARLQLDPTNAKGLTGAEWKRTGALAWAVTALQGQTVWITVQLDNTVTGTTIDASASGGPGTAISVVPMDTLPADWGASSATDTDGSVAIYAVWTVAAAGDTGDFMFMFGQIPA